MNKQKKVVIIGGGITGLTTAFYLQRLSAEAQLPLDIHVVEKSERWGGKIHTVEHEGCIMEKGPDSFLSRKTPILDLTRELSLEDELATLNPKAGKTYIVHQNRFHSMPPGLILGIPTQLGPFVKSGMISPLGKLRAAMDLFLPKRKEKSDEALGDFIERRLGSEVQERIVEPLLAGIYAGNLNQLSLQATFPQFQAIEQKYGSLIRGMMLNRQQTKTSTELPEIAKQSMFLTYKKGLSTLVHALVESLTKQGVHLHSNIEVEQIDKVVSEATESEAKNAKINSNSNSYAKYEIKLRSDESIFADAVILTVPPPILSKWINDVPELNAFQQMKYVSVANVLMIFDKSKVTSRLDGSGFLVSKREGRTITACTWTSSKWKHTAPDDKALIRCYVGRAGQEQWVDWSDEEMITKVRKDLEELMGLTAEPIYTEITRWPHAMPQYGVGHREFIQQARTALVNQYPLIDMTGSGFEGLGIPDCIQQAKISAQNILEKLRKNS